MLRPIMGVLQIRGSYCRGEGKIGLRAGGGGGGVVGAPRRRGGVWQWGSCDRTLGKVPITSNRGC